MATEKRYLNGVVIIEPHGKIVGNSVGKLQKAILPEVKAFDQPRILINLKHATSHELFRTRRPHASLCHYKAQGRAHCCHTCWQTHQKPTRFESADVSL